MVTRVDAPAEILDEDLDRLFMLHGPDDDARILGGMVDGVGEEVGNDPCDLFVVDEQFRNLLGVFHLDEAAETLGQHLRRLDGIVDQFDRFHNLGHEPEFTGLDLRHVEQFARDIEQAVAALADAAHELLLFFVELPETVVAEQLQAHQDRRDGGFHLVRNRRDEIGLGRVQLLVFGDVVQDDQVADELLLAAADRHDVERRILHLEIALLVVGIDLQRLLPGVLLLAVKLAQQAPEQVVGKRHLGGIAPDDGLRQVEHRQRLAVHEEDGLPGIESDDRFVERIDDRLDPRLGRHQVIKRTAAVFVELGRHVVERLGNGFELTVAREVEPLPVIMAGNLLDSLLQLVDRAQHHPREPHQHGARDKGAQGGHDDQPPHDIVGTLLDPRTLGPDGRHVHLHNAIEVGTHGLYLGLGDGVAQAGDMLLQGRRKLLFADFGDVLLLERQSLAQGVPRDGILADVVQRPEHVPGVLQRIIVVGQDGARSARKLADVADRLDAEQQDHGEQHADAQGKPPLYLHSHDIIKRSMFIRDRRPSQNDTPGAGVRASCRNFPACGKAWRCRCPAGGRPRPCCLWCIRVP